MRFMKKNDTKDEKVFIVTRKMIRRIVIFFIVLLIAGLVVVVWSLRGNNIKSFETPASTKSASSDVFTLTSEAGDDDGTLPTEYTCDGLGISPALSWSGTPIGTREFAVMMTTIPVDGAKKWSWVLYNIPSSTRSLIKGRTGVGKTGAYIESSAQIYHAPCSQGPGLNKYTFTVYALSENPELSTNQAEVTGEVLTKAISDITISSASLSLSYQRSQ